MQNFDKKFFFLFCPRLLGFLGHWAFGQNYFLRYIYKMFRSYCLTIRPRDGITEKTTSETIKWLHKCTHSFAVLEKSDHEKHLHAQIWLDKPRARGDICKQVQRICERTIEDWDSSQLKVLRQGVKIAYSDWYLDYLAENDLKTTPNIIVDNPPTTKTLEYYPTEEEQAQTQAVATSVDPQFSKYEIDYLEWLGDSPITQQSVATWLLYSCVQARTIKLPRLQRDREALCIALYAYVSKSTDIYLFMKKPKDLVKLEENLSKLNIQCPANEFMQDHYFQELSQYEPSIDGLASLDEQDLDQV